MKTYEKPKLMVLSISANDTLCSGCATKTRDNAFFTGLFDKNNDGIFDENDFSYLSPSFTEGDCEKAYENYCKYTHDDPIFTS